MNIVLHEPGIALNTGNIGRTCAATGTRLHLIKPYAFRINEKEIRRAGMDYWKDVDLSEYLDYEDFISSNPGILDNDGDAPGLWFATTKAPRSYTDVKYGPDDFIIFGNESRGIPEEILVAHPDRCIRIPMAGGARSLNLANSAAIVLYEALRQNGFTGLEKTGSLHHLSWPETFEEKKPACFPADTMAFAGGIGGAASGSVSYGTAAAESGSQSRRLISLVVSVYNEEAGLRRFYDTAAGVIEDTLNGRNLAGTGGCTYDYEICFVNDGSNDGSSIILEELRNADPVHVTVVSFSRNFGHEAAMTAGLDYASGDYLIFMDADLQHPPALIPRILDGFESGSGVISMVRTSNTSAGSMKNITSGIFYRLINLISDASMVPGASDFFAVDKKAADVLRSSFRERTRFLRGYVQNIGFQKITIEYEAGARVAGESHYSLKKLWKLSMDTIISFSEVPLRLGFFAGFISGIGALAALVCAVISSGEGTAQTALMAALICLISAVLFILLGIMGSYMAALLRESRERPLYIVDSVEQAVIGQGSSRYGSG